RGRGGGTTGSDRTSDLRRLSVMRLGQALRRKPDCCPWNTRIACAWVHEIFLEEVDYAFQGSQGDPGRCAAADRARCAAQRREEVRPNGGRCGRRGGCTGCGRGEL